MGITYHFNCYFSQVYSDRELSTCVVYWPSTRPNMPFQRRGSCIFHWSRRAWLIIWDKVKSRGTVIDRCTGRKWPVNCMTVISARWQSNMPFQRQQKWHISDGQLRGDIEWAIELLYNLVKRGSQLVWRPDQLVTRCWNENISQRGWAPRPPGAALENEKNATLMAIRVLVNMLKFCSVSNSLSQ